MKVCTKCKTEKELTEFYKKLDGLQPSCKDCCKAYEAQRFAEDPKPKLARNAKYAERCPERCAYQKAKWDAINSRGIDWEFTFETWMAVWKGQFHLRGTRPDSLCMCRFGDKGPYSPDNVAIATNRENALCLI